MATVVEPGTRSTVSPNVIDGEWVKDLYEDLDVVYSGLPEHQRHLLASVVSRCMVEHYGTGTFRQWRRAHSAN